MPGQSTKKSSKSRDERPARAKYWSTKKLRTNKVRRIMRAAGGGRVTKEQATKMWDEARKTRRKGF